MRAPIWMARYTLVNNNPPNAPATPSNSTTTTHQQLDNTYKSSGNHQMIIRPTLIKWELIDKQINQFSADSFKLADRYELVTWDLLHRPILESRNNCPFLQYSYVGCTQKTSRQNDAPSITFFTDSITWWYRPACDHGFPTAMALTRLRSATSN